MARYLLDADTVSYALRGQGVADRILQHPPSELCVSSITLAEPGFGAQDARHIRENMHLHVGVVSTRVMTVESIPRSASGKFEVSGVYVREHGGPVRVDEVPDARPAKYSGSTLRSSAVRNVLLVFMGWAPRRS